MGDQGVANLVHTVFPAFLEPLQSPRTRTVKTTGSSFLPGSPVPPDLGEPTDASPASSSWEGLNHQQKRPRAQAQHEHASQWRFSPVVPGPGW